MTWNAWFQAGYDLISKVKIHRPASSASKTGACMCWTRQRRLQTCYIKCSAVGIRCTFLWENIWPSWRKWTSAIQEEFSSLSCAPLKDENSSCEQAPQWDIKMLRWDLFPHKSSECDCSFLVDPVHDECCDAVYLLRPQCLNHQVVLGQRHLQQPYFKSHFSRLCQATAPFLSPCLCSSAFKWPSCLIRIILYMQLAANAHFPSSCTVEQLCFIEN